MRNNRVAQEYLPSNETSSHNVCEMHKQQEGVCRICLEEDQNLIKPCACSGSIQLIHEKCLKKWIEVNVKKGFSRRIKCQICQCHIYFELKIGRQYKCSEMCEGLKKISTNYIIILSLLLFLLIGFVMIKINPLLNFGNDGDFSLYAAITFLILALMFTVALIFIKSCLREKKVIKRVLSYRQSRQLEAQREKKNKARARENEVMETIYS